MVRAAGPARHQRGIEQVAQGLDVGRLGVADRLVATIHFGLEEEADDLDIAGDGDQGIHGLPP